jgi:Ca2+/Na+ antiporter
VVIVALLLIAAGIIAVRVGWSGPNRLAWAGWAAAVAGLVALTLRDGAWGLAIGTVAGSAIALVLVLYAGWVSPARPRRPAREAPAAVLPRRWPDVARRVAVFVLVVPVAFVAAQWLTFGAQAIARRGGMGEADATALALFLQPTLWGVLMTVQMTRANLARMIAPPAVAAVLGTMLWSAS